MDDREPELRPPRAGKPPTRLPRLSEREVDRLLARLAKRRYGVVLRRELIAAGVSRHSIDHRIASGALHVLHRGIYAVGHLALHPHAPLAAALLAAGSGSVLSHRTAAEHREMLLPVPGPLHVTRSSHRARRPGLLLHCAVLEPADVRVVKGLQVTSPIRTLQDLAATEPASVERAVNEALANRLIRPGELEPVAGRRGARALRAALGDRPGFTRSEAERMLLRLVTRAGLPRPRANVGVEGWEADLFWPEQRLVVEMDGYAAHSGRRAFERDRRKDVELQARGYRVVRLTYRQITEHPERTVAQLTTLLLS